MVKLENLGHLDKTIHREDVDMVLSKLAYSDWLILYFLAQSMDKKNFGALVRNLAGELPLNPYIKQVEMEDTTPPPGYESSKIDEVDAGTLDRSSSARSTLKSNQKFPSLLRKSLKRNN